MVALNFWIGTGSADDPDGLFGLAHFVEHMLFKRGADERILDLAETVQDAGGYLNAATGCDHTVYYQIVPPDRWRDVLAAQAGAVVSPPFELRDIDGERSVIVEEARSAEADPASFLWHRLMETAFLSHPCRRPVVGTEASLTRISAADLRRHHRAHYVPANMIQVVVGDVDADDVVAGADEFLGSIPGGASAPTARREEPPQRELRARSFAGPWAQSSVALAFHAPGVLDPDTPALDVACGLLGAGRSSRLRKSLQTARGLVSDVSAGVVAYRDVGAVVVTASVVGRDIDRVTEELFGELQTLRGGRAGPEEFEKMLRRLEAGYVLEHETAGSIAGAMGLFETLGDHRYFEDYVDRLASVTPEDVLRVADRYLGPESASVVTYAPEGTGVPTGDRCHDVARLAERGAGSRAASVAERGAPWKPARPFERPMILGERGVSRCEREEIPGGGTLLVSEERALPIASVAVAFRAGFLEEPDALSGITYLTQKLVLRGTSHRSADELADEVEGLGTAIASAIDRDGFGFGMTVLSEHFQSGLSILGGVMTDPLVSGDELAKVRAEVIAEIEQLSDHPLRRAMLLMLPLAFPGHKYGRPLRGSRESVAEITLADVRRWYARTFDVRNLIVCVVGDVERVAVREAVADLAGHLPPGARSAPGQTVVVVPGGQRDVAHGTSAQSTVAIGLRGPRAGTRDDVALRVMSRSLSMMGGRLWRALRERPPFAYFVGSSVMALRHGGCTFAHATAPRGQEEAALDALVSEFAGLQEGGLEEAELRRAKRHLAGTFAISMERGAARAAGYVMAEATGAGYEFVQRMPALVRDVTHDDVVRVARRYLDPGEGFASVILRGDEPGRREGRSG